MTESELKKKIPLKVVLKTTKKWGNFDKVLKENAFDSTFSSL